jgi:hypothetical protein
MILMFCKAKNLLLDEESYPSLSFRISIAPAQVYQSPMSNRLNPGVGEKSPEQRRSASAERFIGQFQKTLITAKDAMGVERQFEVLAITGPPKNVVGEVGAFWGMYVEKGDTYLQGGTVFGGNGNKTVEDIKVLDRKTVAATLVGKKLWVEIGFNGVVADGVLLPGGDVTSAKCSAQSTAGKDLPPNTLPTAKSPNAKKVFYEVGRWTKDGFFPSRTGHISVGFCPGGYNIS